MQMLYGKSTVLSHWSACRRRGVQDLGDCEASTFAGFRSVNMTMGLVFATLELDSGSSTETQTLFA